MKYFTRAWASGDLSDTEQEQILESYQEHLSRHRSVLSGNIAKLATRISLHDGLVRRVVIDRRTVELKLELLCGDNQVGYFDLDLTYRGVQWDGFDLEVLERRARDRRTEILYDEVDVLSDGVFEHALLFWPEDEVSIRFYELDIVKTVRDEPSIAFAGDPVVVRDRGRLR